MKVLLADLDFPARPYASHAYGFGNLALMKLSAWHKARGDEVFLNFALAGCDQCYVSCVFSWNTHRREYYPDGLVGGSGFSLDTKLPDEAEHIMPDYSLYDLDHSMGFTSRGCIRRCPWCDVPQKEGGITPWASIYEFWDRRHYMIMLLDNNLLASPNWKDTLRDLIKEKLLVDINQGLDIRLVDDEKAHYLSKLTVGDYYRFSFDLPQMAQAVREGVRLLEGAGIPSSKLLFYVLVGFDTNFEQDRERFALLKSLNCQAFPMQYNGQLPAEGRIVEKDLPRGPRGAVRKYVRSARRTSK